MSAIFVGVDPGFTGAIAVLEDVEGAEYAEVWDMPLLSKEGAKRLDRDAIRGLIEACGAFKIFAVVEAVGAMGGKGRKEGASSMFRFGQGQGEILGILSGLGAMVFEVIPGTWKMKCGLVHVSEKEVCKRASALFPEQELFGPKGGPLHGRAEALFLAAYARMIVEGRQIHDRR